MKWNVKNINFLYPPDVFTGSFDNDKMQARHEEQVRQKLDALKTALDLEADPFAAMKKLNVRDHIQFLLNNQIVFRESGNFEESVVYLYRRLNAPFSTGGDIKVWNYLFESCNRERLSQLGDTVTLTAATVYRGSVSGVQRSLSWTPDRDRAMKFADRWKDTSLGGGELYEVDIVGSNILFYQKQTHEDVLILDPAFIETAAIRSFKKN